MDTPNKPDLILNDLIWGAEAIGREIGLSPPTVFKQLRAGLLPGRRVGKRWVVSRSELRQWFRSTAA